MALKFQPPQGVDTTSPNEAFNKGLGNSLSNLPTLYAQTKLAKMKQDMEIAALNRQSKNDEFDKDYKTKDLGLKENANVLASKREDRMADNQAALLDIRERLAALAEKTGTAKQEATEAKTAQLKDNSAVRQKAAMQQADRVIDKVDQALGKVSGWSTGWGAKILGSIPATSAKSLNADVKTIKANLGFAELHAMREASPTGGALGQVAVQELEMLQSTLENLDTELDAPQLIENLKSVKTHFENWKKAVSDAEAEGGVSEEDAAAIAELTKRGKDITPETIAQAKKLMGGGK